VVNVAPIVEHESHPSHRENPMTNHPLYDIAVVIAHIFVVRMSVAAVAAVPILLIIALL
jgi:hypothetical protein